MSNKDFSQGIVTELEKAAAEYAASGNQKNSEYTVEMKKASFEAGYRYAINLLKKNDTYENTKDASEGHMPVANPVRAFLDDILLGASWNMLPYEILHSLYGEYCADWKLNGLPG